MRLAFGQLGSFEYGLKLAAAHLREAEGLDDDGAARRLLPSGAKLAARRAEVLVALGLDPSLLQETTGLKRAFDRLARMEFFFLRSHGPSAAATLRQVKHERARVRRLARLAAKEKANAAAAALVELGGE